jgi:hexosaminidase
MNTSGIDGLVLLPTPRQLTRKLGVFSFKDQCLIQIDAEKPQALCFSVGKFQRALQSQLGLTWETNAGKGIPPAEVGMVMRIAPHEIGHPQGYRVEISPEAILVQANDEAGAYYAVATLVQVITTLGREFPCLEIIDWPDFPARGVMLDVSRDKVPRMETLYGLVDMLSGWKINQLQLYMEHTFAYRNHPEVWAEASPFTAQEILDLDAFCRQRQVELVPNQNSFGHMNRWLKLPRYQGLAEAPGNQDSHWGPDPFTLCPTDPASLDLVRGLYDELLPNFSSRLFNVGCDETFDLGQGRSKQACQDRGVGRVYLDFLLNIYQEVKERGFTMQFWGDIIIQHPELVPDLPKDVIALEWGYEANHPFDDHCARFAASGIPFYVCPGTSAWNSLAGRTDNAIENLRSAAQNGLKHGAVGYLNTDWGDHGHWQVLPVSYLGFAAGAAYAWCLEANQGLYLSSAISTHAFTDPAGIMGQVAYDLGNSYRAVGFEPPNSSALFWALAYPLDPDPSIPPDAFQRALDAIEAATAGLDSHQMKIPDAPLVQRELENTARLMRHACRKGLLTHEGDPDKVREIKANLARDLRGIIQVYQRIWLERNRPGGLKDSLARLERMFDDYKEN